jgi:hypothetical protein
LLSITAAAVRCRKKLIVLKLLLGFGHGDSGLRWPSRPAAKTMATVSNSGYRFPPGRFWLSFCKVDDL